jgi:hypothetical protein
MAVGFLHLNLESSLCFFQRAGQLVGAGGGLHAAGGALQASDDIIDIHALYERADALEVAVATTDEFNILNLVVLDLKNDLTGTGALGLVTVLHNVNFLPLFGNVGALSTDQIYKFIGIKDHLVTPFTGRHGDLLVQQAGFVKICGVFLFHTYGTASATDIARAGKQLFYRDQVDFFVAGIDGGFFKV